MLEALTIQNLATLSQVDLEITPGFTAITGETGAGKSLLLDALELALGERADASLVRTGAERAQVSAVFRSDRSATLRTGSPTMTLTRPTSS